MFPQQKFSTVGSFWVRPTIFRTTHVCVYVCFDKELSNQLINSTVNVSII